MDDHSESRQPVRRRALFGRVNLALAALAGRGGLAGAAGTQAGIAMVNTMHAMQAAMVDSAMNRIHGHQPPPPGRLRSCGRPNIYGALVKGGGVWVLPSGARYKEDQKTGAWRRV